MAGYLYWVAVVDQYDVLVHIVSSSKQKLLQILRYDGRRFKSIQTGLMQTPGNNGTFSTKPLIEPGYSRVEVGRKELVEMIERYR